MKIRNGFKLFNGKCKNNSSPKSDIIQRWKKLFLCSGDFAAIDNKEEKKVRVIEDAYSSLVDEEDEVLMDPIIEEEEDEDEIEEVCLEAPHLRKCPVGANFGFGGKLVTFQNIPISAGAKSNNSEVYVHDLVTDQSLVSRSAEFESVFKDGEKSSLQLYCERKYLESLSKDESENCSLFKVLFEEDGTARTKLLTYPGFSVPNREHEHAINEARALDNAEEHISLANEAEEFFANLQLLENNLVDENVVTNVKVIKKCSVDDALDVGDHKETILQCIEADKMADALVIATDSDPSLLEFTHDWYLKNSISPYKKGHMEDWNTNVNPDDILKKKLEEKARKRKELQTVEIELKAQAMARSEMINLENRFQLKISECIDAASLLKEQLGERQQHIEQLEMKLVEMDRELGAVKLENEAAWAENDLLREQFKELATLRRELDNSEAERAQRVQQMQEKERQILLLEEQNRAAQETILFKDEKLREAQSRAARRQETDALQSTALQAQLQDRLQRQFAEVERRHLQTIQQLQLELAEARDMINHQPALTQQNLSGSDHHCSSDNHVNQQQLRQSFQPSLVFKRSLIAVHEQMTLFVSRLTQDQFLASAKGKPAPEELKCSNKTEENNEKKEKISEPDSIKRTSNSAPPTQLSKPAHLDERALLGCIVRAIPPGARVRISTTLPNRLGKMLAPLRWHDYGRRYGNLDSFVARHPELFVIVGDFVHLREGAHEVISATTAKAKVAAASSSAPYTSTLHSVALTPFSKNNGNKKITSHQQLNGGSFSVAQGISNMNISDKSENYLEVDGLLTKNLVTVAGASKGYAYANVSMGAKEQARSLDG